MFEFQEIKNATEYDPLMINKNAPFTQAWFFGEWQEAMGRKVRRFKIMKDSGTTGFFQVIKYPLIFSKNFLYIPHAPVLQSFSEGGDQLPREFLKEFHEKLLEIAKEENAVFLKFDPFLPRRNFSEGGSDMSKYFKKTPIAHYHSSYFQPKFEWILNLEKSEEEILSGMHPKTRYNIGLAKRKGIKIEIISGNFEKYFDDFYKLLEETTKRDNFNLHPKTYYQNIFSRCGEDKNAFLSVAKYDGKILAINLILLFGNAACFLFGGSSSEHKNLMFSHLAQWEAIKEAKKRRFSIYNFGGVDNNGNYKALGGVSIFKKRFGGELLEYSDSYDLILKPFWYYLYNLMKLLKR